MHTTNSCIDMHPDFPHALEEKRPDKISGRKTDSKVSQGEMEHCVVRKVSSCMHENHIIFKLRTEYISSWYFEVLLRRLLLLRKPDPPAIVTFSADYRGRAWAYPPWSGEHFFFVCLTSMLFPYSLNYCSFRSRKGPENTLPL